MCSKQGKIKKNAPVPTDNLIKKKERGKKRIKNQWEVDDDCKSIWFYQCWLLRFRLNESISE